MGLEGEDSEGDIEGSRIEKRLGVSEGSNMMRNLRREEV